MYQSHPKITVIMPVYNGEPYLDEAINSILIQTFTDFEFLIIDDGSTDRSLEIIQRYQDSRIKLIRNPINKGLVDSLNLGLSLAKGEYIARMDCDDISKADRLEKQVRFLIEHPDIGVIGSCIDIIDNNSKIIQTWIYPAESELIKWELFFHCPFAHPSIMFGKKLVKQVNGYSNKYPHAEDYELWWRLYDLTNFSNLSESLLLYRVHDKNVTNIHKKAQIDNAAKIHHYYLEKYLQKKIDYQVSCNLFRHNFDNLIKNKKIIKLIFDIFKIFQYRNTNDQKKLHKLRLELLRKIYCMTRSYLKSINFN
jgi:glycosyltransferase involved in cell wall biosynthesis